MYFDRMHIPLQEKLNNFLLQYRKVPHVTTGQSPSMLLMERERSRLHNLIPDVKEKLGTTKEARQVEVGVRVASRNYIGEKWKFGRVHRILGKLHYIINLDDGSRVKRHIDQIRQIEEETASDVEERGPEMIPSEDEDLHRNALRLPKHSKMFLTPRLGLLMIIILRFQVMNIQHQYGSLPELLRNP